MHRRTSSSQRENPLQRFSDYLVAAFGWFARVVLNAGNPTLQSLGIGTPMKSMALEFHKVLRTDELFDMTVRLGEIRRRTFDVKIEARGLDGDVHFAGRLSPILIDGATFRSVEIPAPIRAALHAYRDAHLAAD